MKMKLMSVVIITLFIGSVSQAKDRKPNQTGNFGKTFSLQASSIGSVQFVNNFDLKKETGRLIITGEAAEQLVVALNLPKEHILARKTCIKGSKPSSTKLSDCERISGTHYNCVLTPEMDTVKDEFKLDRDDNILTSPVCFLNIKNVKTGEIEN